MRWSGNIAFRTTSENPTGSGVYKQTVTTKHFYGEVYRVSRRLSNSPNGTNDDVSISVEINVVGNAYLSSNFMDMLYVTYLGKRWKITNADPTDYPNIKLSLGGLYNGE